MTYVENNIPFYKKTNFLVNFKSVINADIIRTMVVGNWFNSDSLKLVLYNISRKNKDGFSYY